MAAAAVILLVGDDLDSITASADTTYMPEARHVAMSNSGDVDSLAGTPTKQLFGDRFGRRENLGVIFDVSPRRWQTSDEQGFNRTNGWFDRLSADY